MRTKACISLAVLFCGLLTVVLVKGWLWYGQLTERIYASVQQQVDFELDAGSVQYDPVNETLLLSSASISAPGLDVSAQSLQLGVNAPGWLDIGRQVFPVTVEYASFSGSSLRVNSPQSLLSLTGLGNTSFHKGVIYPGLNSAPRSFLFLGLNPQSESIVDIEGSGGNGLNWLFTGTLNAENDQILGNLDFDHQDIAQFLSDSNYSGHFNASLSFSWSDSQPLMLTGNIWGDEGRYQSDDFLFVWDAWQLSDIHLSDWLFTGEAQALHLDGAGLQLSDARIDHFFNWLKKQPFVLGQLNLDRLKIKPLPNADDIVFDKASLTLRAGNRLAQFVATPLAGGKLTIKAGQGNAYQLKFDDVVPERLGLLSAVQRFEFADRKYSFSYNSNTGEARLSFQQGRARDSFSLTERLLFDQNGRAELDFEIKNVALLDLGRVIRSEIDQQLEAITNAPFSYLSQFTDVPLLSYMEHIPGKADLTPDSDNNFKSLKTLSELRPGLNWQLETSVSDSEDWPQIARHQLDQTLADLSSENGTPPEEEREKLVEQLYLVTQKQKMPDVGLVSKEERLLQAEQWLIDSWPKNPELIDQLIDARKAYLANSMEKNGLRGITILSARQDGGQPRSRLLIK